MSDAENLKILRSRESNIRSFVRFTNCSERNCEVHWLDFRGNNVHYKNLNPTSNCVINTFVTHPWVFLCSTTGERLCVRNKEVFFPSPWFKFIRNSSNETVSVQREDLIIHIKLKSLREICLWRINFLIKSRKSILHLQIPNTLRNDLLKVFHLSTRCRQQQEEEPVISDSSSD